MTVEFHDEEVIAHVDKEHFVIGRHPIINTKRTYLAFQVSGTGAAFDNFSVWQSVLKDNWKAKRSGLTSSQAKRSPAIKRDAREQYDLIMLNLKDRLSRNDAKYQNLLNRHEKLKSTLKTDYPKAFLTHKELSKGIAKRRKEIKERDPRFKEMESAVNKARQKEKAYIHSRHAELDDLPKHLYYAAFEKCRKSMRNDSRLAALEKITATLGADLHRAFPAAFSNVGDLVDQRNAYASSLKKNKEFSLRKKAIAAANATEFGLAAYAYTRDVGRVFRLSDELEYGLIGINSGLITTVEVPFGGLKESGLGKEGGSQGLSDYLETKYTALAGI